MSICIMTLIEYVQALSDNPYDAGLFNLRAGAALLKKDGWIGTMLFG